MWNYHRGDYDRKSILGIETRPYLVSHHQEFAETLSLAELGLEVNNNNLHSSREVWTAPVLMQVQQAVGFLVAEQRERIGDRLMRLTW